MMDAAETGRLRDAIKKLLPALEAFNQFEGPDPAARRRATWTEALDEPLPRRGVGLDGVLRELTETLIPNGLRIGAPGFNAWITTAPTTSGTVADLAATVAGAQRWWVHPFNYVETLALKWLAELLGIPGDLQGTFTGGGSVANLVCLGGARQRAFERLGKDASRDGLPANVRWRIYASSEVHHVIARSAAILGLGRSSVAPVAVDSGQRIDLNALREILERDKGDGILPIAIVVTAGTVNTGAIDPIEEMANMADEFDTWLHIDGAYGMFGLLDDRIAHLYRGLDRADSIAVDPHKWLAAPVGCGAAFVRDRELLFRTFTLESAEYLEESVGVEKIESPFDDLGDTYHDFNTEQSAPSRGVEVWAILKEIGADGMRDRVVRHNNFARHLASRVEADEHLELLAAPTLSICCFRYSVSGMDEGSLDKVNTEITRRLRADGRYIPSTTRAGGKLAIRPCYINPRTRLSDVDGLVESVVAIGKELTS